MEKLLTAKDLQVMLNMSKKSVYELMHSDGFPTITLRERLYVSQEAFSKWLDSMIGEKFLF